MPEVAPNITSIELVKNTMVRLNWSALPEDIDLYNAYELSGYEIEIVPLVPLLVSSECQYFIFTLNNIAITSLEHTTHCEPMKIFNVTIAAVNHKGRGVKNEYCYTLGRTSMSNSFLFCSFHAFVYCMYLRVLIIVKNKPLFRANLDILF